MAEHEIEDLGRQALERFNDDDWDGLRARFADDIVYEETGTGQRIEGADTLVGALRGWKNALPDLRGEVERVVSQGGTVALEIRWRGTHEGPLETPAGAVPASGAVVEMYSTFWLEFRDGLVVSHRNHLDTLSLLAQIGALGG